MAHSKHAKPRTNSTPPTTLWRTNSNNNQSKSKSSGGAGNTGNQQAMSVNKQHLSARAKAITGKLQEAHGSELRRTLFSLRQIFQDDSELATEFIESGGLECLMKVAADADQIHQNYILRALGQLIAHPNGMNGLARHNETIQWLYTLLVSQNRLVVETSIELLLLFVRYSDNNCLRFCRAIKAIEESKGKTLWTNLIEIFVNYNNNNGGWADQPHKDVELLVLAMTLINKTLAGIPDQDTFYDFVDPLEELGMKTIIKRHSQVDKQLKRQFEIYEQVLESEDANKDNSCSQHHKKPQQDSIKSIESNNKSSSLSSTATVANGNESEMILPRMSDNHQTEKSWHSKDDAGNVDDDDDDDVDDDAEEAEVEMDEQVVNVVVAEGHQREKQQVSLTNGDNVSGSEERAPLCVDEMNEENYESANDESNESQHLSSEQTPQRDVAVSSPPAASNKMQSSPPASARAPLVQHGNSIKQNLSRGKQQRASISSCSSSDSYASYGSGYASGSGNSTDHELKQNNPTNTNDEAAKSGDVNNDVRDEDDDDDAQLKQHLSELEQLTDELANRNIFGLTSKPIQSTSKHHFASPIKPSASNSSSILSTGSSFSVDDDTPTKVQPPPPPPPSSSSNNESRSTTATPTSTVQPNSTSTTSTPAYVATSHSTTNGEMSPQKPIVRHANQYVASTASPTMQKLQSKVAPTPLSSVSKQDSRNQTAGQWEHLSNNRVTRPLLINDLDFTDLRDEDDYDLLNMSNNNMSRSRNQVNDALTINIPGAQKHTQDSQGAGHDSTDGESARSRNSSTPAAAPPPMPPPPMSPWFNTIAGSRPQSQFTSSPSPPYDYGPGQQQSSGDFNRERSPANSTYSNYSRNSVCMPQTSTPSRDSAVQYSTMQPASSLRSASSMSSLLFGNNGKNGYKRRKTMKLFWKEVREDRSLLSKISKKKTIWDEIKPVQVDTEKLEQLFESKAKDLSLSKSRIGLDGSNQRKVKITVLDAKRSNAINIGMTKLPPMRTIKSAILKMDSSIMNREGIEKILTTMLPTEEEKSKIIEAQLSNPDTPLGTAEQFLLNLASISALEARLKLWAFQLDYAQIEREVAEPLMDLKQAIEEVEGSETFRIILGTLLAIGNFLNSTNAKGFQIDYLEKVPEVKDTVHKHSLLHHLCLFIQEKYDPEQTTDLYSEFSAVNRASKIDYGEVAKNLKKMEQDCQASWDYLKIVAKQDGLANLMNSCGSSSSIDSSTSSGQTKSTGKLNNLSRLSMITAVMENSRAYNEQQKEQQNQPVTKHSKTKVSDFLKECAERIMVLMVIHRRVMNRFKKLLVYLGCSSHQIKQTEPQQIFKIINEFALEYRTKRERVREMLMRKKQCQHHHNANRWQMSRSRWAGSHQYINSLGYNHHQNRPCSTTSSCASTCLDSLCTNGPMASNHNNQSGNRAGSPSGFSQISNYSDYLFDQSCCNSRQQSVTPLPSEKGIGNNQYPNRMNSISMSMFDLQQQQQQQQQHNYRSPNKSFGGTTSMGNGHHSHHEEDESNADGVDDDRQARQNDEQLRRLLGAGKSLDGACGDLYQMGHWSSSMARVTRHPVTPSVNGVKQRAASIDSQHDVDGEESLSRPQQSSYYRHLNGHRQSIEDGEQNSDDEILQSLVRTATAKSSHNRSANGSISAANKSAKTKILSRFSCDRKSLRRTFAGGIELSNVS